MKFFEKPASALGGMWGGGGGVATMIGSAVLSECMDVWELFKKLCTFLTSFLWIRIAGRTSSFRPWFE